MAIKTNVGISTGILVALCNLATSPAEAATFDVTSVKLGSLVDASDSTVNGITYLNQSLPITGLTANSIKYNFGSFLQPAVTLRRGGYAPPADDTFGNYNNRQVVWGERIPGYPNSTVRIPQPTTAQAMLSQNNILGGVDNIFVNAGYINGIQTDIERVDFVFNTGVETSPNLAIPFFDRGFSTAHDGFQIAPILSIDGASNPTSYGSLTSIAPGWGQTNLRPGGGSNDNLPFTVLNDSSGAFSNALTNEQQTGGIVIPLSELSATPSTIYGYSLFAPDVNDGGNPTNLLNLTNAAVFPQNTPNNIGGLDLISGSGFVVQAVPEPSTIWGLLVCGSLFAAFRGKRTFYQKG